MRTDPFVQGAACRLLASKWGEYDFYHSLKKKITCGPRVLYSMPVGNNCDSLGSDNKGCGVKLTDSRSFGQEFNNNGGGWCVDDL